MYKSLIIGSVEIISMYSALMYTLGIKIKNKYFLLLFIFSILPTVYVYLFFTYWLGIITLFVTTIFVFYKISNNFRVGIDVCFVFIGGILVDHFSQIISALLFGNSDFLQWGVKLVVFILVFAAYISLYKWSLKKLELYLSMTITIQLIVFVITSITICILYLNMFIPKNKEEFFLVKFNLLIQLCYFLLMVLLFGFLLHNVKKNQQVKQRALDLEQFTMYMEALEQVNRDMQKFRHDYSNILLTMRGYMNDENIDGLKEYFQQHILKMEEQTLFKNKIMGNLELLTLVSLKGILATKAFQADERGIRTIIEVPEIIDHINMDIIDLTRIIGIFLDNAIEASDSVDISEINIACINTEQQSKLIVIQNRVGKVKFNIREIFKEGFSTKGNGRGTGLSNVKSILNKHSNTTLNTRIENNWFIQELEIQNKIQ